MIHAGLRSRRLLVGAVAMVLLVVGVVVASTRSGDAPPGAAPGGSPRFVDETATAGVDHRYDGEFQFFVGGGVAAFDCNDDGRAELYFAGGTEPAALYRNESPVGAALRFVHDVSPVTDLTSVTGAYPVDVDSDGHTDLVVLRVGENVVLRGLGDCRFERANERFGLDGGTDWTAAFSATWEGTNTLPTLAFGSYLVPGDPVSSNTVPGDPVSSNTVPGDPVSSNTASGDTVCADSRLLRPETSGDRYGPPVALTPGYCTLSMLFSDWSRSGRRDLRMSNDRHYYTDGEEQLWRMTPGEPPRQYTAADGWRPLRIWGMGIASQDLTGDGYPELFITSQGDNKLQTLDGGATQPSYRDIALRRGVTAQRPFTGGDVLPSTAWHPEFADVNNDGFVDLFITKGNVEAQPDFADRDPNDLLIGQADGAFVEGAAAAGIVGFNRARGAALVDLNLDGMLDLIVVNRRRPATLWRNVGHGNAAQPASMGHWIAVRLHEAAPNVDAVGAWVEVRMGGRTVVRELIVGGGHAGGQTGWMHSGLGSANAAEIRVQWPDGETGPWMRVAADSFVRIERGATAPIPWKFGG